MWKIYSNFDRLTCDDLMYSIHIFLSLSCFSLFLFSLRIFATFSCFYACISLAFCNVAYLKMNTWIVVIVAPQKMDRMKQMNNNNNNNNKIGSVKRAKTQNHVLIREIHALRQQCIKEQSMIFFRSFFNKYYCYYQRWMFVLCGNAFFDCSRKWSLQNKAEKKRCMEFHGIIKKSR